MSNDPAQPSCITIRYGNKRYLLCADEVTNFLVNCNAIGLSSVDHITDHLELIAGQIEAMKPNKISQKKLSIDLINEIILSMKACLFVDQ